MPHDIRIPRLGWSMEEGVFVGWLKLPGDSVAVGEALYELESDKALQQIESLDAGTLFVPPDAPAAGATVAVGTLLGYLLAAGEPIPAPATSSPEPEEGDAANTILATPRATTNRSANQPIASPRARRVALELGVDWQSLCGSGRGGRIREADVRAAKTLADDAIVGPTPNRTGSVSLSPRRKAIIEKLKNSLYCTVPVTLTSTADATNLVERREGFRSAGETVVPAYTDIIARLVAQSLARHPRMAVKWDEDQGALISLGLEELHVAIAVETPDGLLAPVVRDATNKSVMEIARESKALIDRARRGRLTAAEMRGGAITITNLGRYGIDVFTPVINYPEIAILGLGAIRLVPVVTSDGRIMPQHRITLSLTFDHAAVDGAPAAAFLQDVVIALAGDLSGA